MGRTTTWAAGLTRLIAERGIKKGALAALSVDDEGNPMQPGMISKILKSDSLPNVATLQRLIKGLHTFDRKQMGPDAAPVELWEFFVSDEQSQLLRQRDIVAKAVVDEQALRERVKKQLLSEMSTALERVVDTELRAVVGGAHKKTR